MMKKMMSLEEFQAKLRGMIEEIIIIDPYSQEYVDNLVDRISQEQAVRM